MKIDEIPVWEAFYGVAKYGNFSRASQMLRVPVPQVSKRVSKLEGYLGVRLFQRSTRVVSLTDEGKALYPKVATFLEDLNNIESSFEDKNKIEGTLKLTCIPFIAHRFLIPILAEFMKLHPHIKIELDLSEKFINLIESQIDLAIRIQEPDDTELVYKKLATNDLIFCASPQYLKNAAPLVKITHLHQHNLLVLDIHKSCSFVKNPGKLQDFLGNRKITCDNGWFLTELALQHYGVLVRSIWDVQEHLKKGRLVQVLKSSPLKSFGNIYAVIPSRRYLAPRVRTFLDFLLVKSAQLQSK